ncbi:Cmx/CmrA family chloramphenicol efflux MFS transporter [Streptomonospora nanhaiensis]|uniref:DHA1 family chloramphenicol resistance protein-like MFS transporter n=1 Tax=Streptomonospora nanhaiensis TaxID=1323731 RepID=A0A853BNM0_9ACTN|nr:Cmx/CmrA family chloramphenicol efflux MFS transporter [Streptomonospora nanhaiensis]MBX9388581.1 MFS transporter [Streptomonospora nanhaiensis]NYI96042.1 DHA1 family chloramphenicol resistance protein-like MFS transporter [Streptomonospora nanhaiensis]
MPLPLYLLALAVFAMGTSEFMLAGLLPDIATDLGVPVATAGLLTSAFAVGMVAGAPLMAALSRTWPRRTALLCFLGLFLGAHVAGALTGAFAVLFATRVVAALANAGFLAVAMTTAAALVPPDRTGRALAVLLGGTTLATIAGVPGGALLGALLDWRATFWAVALLCVPAALGVLRGIPAGPAADRGAPAPALRRELARLRSPRLLLVMALGALVNAATFGTFTFLATIATGTAGLDELWVPAVLVLFGLGSFAGVTAAGRLSDRRPGLVVAVTGPLLLVGWIALGLSAAHPAALPALVFAQGALSFALGGTLIARVLYAAAGAPTMAGSYATAALNVGAAAGPAVAAAALGTAAAGLGPVWASAALVAAALLVAAPFPRALAGAARPAERV